MLFRRCGCFGRGTVRQSFRLSLIFFFAYLLTEDRRSYRPTVLFSRWDSSGRTQSIALESTSWQAWTSSCRRPCTKSLWPCLYQRKCLCKNQWLSPLSFCKCSLEMTEKGCVGIYSSVGPTSTLEGLPTSRETRGLGRLEYGRLDASQFVHK